jgi:hypothetical protein
MTDKFYDASRDGDGKGSSYIFEHWYFVDYHPFTYAIRFRRTTAWAGYTHNEQDVFTEAGDWMPAEVQGWFNGA